MTNLSEIGIKARELTKLFKQEELLWSDKQELEKREKEIQALIREKLREIIKEEIKV